MLLRKFRDLPVLFEREEVLAIFNFHMSPVRRAAGQSLAAAAAYQRRGMLYDSRTGMNYDYHRRGGHLGGGLVGWNPDDLAGLVTMLELAEKHPRAILGRKIDAALPHELPLSAHMRIANGFGLWLHDRHGVTVQYDIHAPDKGGSALNIHAHFLLSARIVKDGQVGPKTRELDVLPSGAEHVTAWRQEWQRRVNRELERAGVSAQIDSRSIAERSAGTGFTLEPLEHLGPERTRIERLGKPTAAGERNRRRLAERSELFQLLRQRTLIIKQTRAWKSIEKAAVDLRSEAGRPNLPPNDLRKITSVDLNGKDLEGAIIRMCESRSDRERSALAKKSIDLAMRHHPTDWPNKLAGTLKENLRGRPHSVRTTVTRAFVDAAKESVTMARSLHKFLSAFVVNERER